jgi:hypothetical protein
MTAAPEVEPVASPPITCHSRSNGQVHRDRLLPSKDPVDALSYAMQMLAKGYADVVIVDLAEDGSAFAPAEFREFYVDTK